MVFWMGWGFVRRVSLMGLGFVRRVFWMGFGWLTVQAVGWMGWDSGQTRKVSWMVLGSEMLMVKRTWWVEEMQWYSGLEKRTVVA